jgi:hypothetical protein
VAKLIILSVILVSFAVPIRLAKSPRPAQALRRTRLTILGFIVIWTFMCLKWYPTLVFLQ